MEPMTWAQASLWAAGAVVCVVGSVSLCFVAITRSYNAIIKAQQSEMNYLHGNINTLRHEQMEERKECQALLLSLGNRISELECKVGRRREEDKP